MSIVFVDTVGLLALWDQSDQWHEQASEAFARLDPVRDTLVTTTCILLECGNAAARRPYRPEVDSLREQFEQARTLVWPTIDDWRTAWAAYRRGQADGAGIVDQVSFVVMRRMQTEKAFTNDRHFRAAGFATMF